MCQFYLFDIRFIVFDKHALDKKKNILLKVTESYNELYLICGIRILSRARLLLSVPYLHDSEIMPPYPIYREKAYSTNNETRN